MLLPHPFDNRPLIPATFVARPNRFIGEFTLPNDDTIHRAHIADPGRLTELMIPGAEVWVVDYRDHPTRKLPYAMPYVTSPEGEMVSIYSRLPNAIVIQAVKATGLPGYEDLRFLRTEPAVTDPITGEKSRLDVALTDDSGTVHLMEVKGASLVEDGICKFPDAPTIRGARQLNTMVRLQQAGTPCHVVMVCQRSDARAFRPHHERDPEFAQAFAHCVNAGVSISVIRIHISANGIELLGTLPLMSEE